MKHEIIKFYPLQIWYVMIHVIKHDMDPNSNINYRRKNSPMGALICVVTTLWGIPHNVVTMVFTAADSFFRISPYCRIDNFFSGVTHNAGFFTVLQIVG